MVEFISGMTLFSINTFLLLICITHMDDLTTSPLAKSLGFLPESTSLKLLGVLY